MADLVPVMLRKLRSASVRLRRAVISQRFGFSPSTIYDDSFYEGGACQSTGRSADAIVALLNARWAPRSVFDFGCGQGWLLGAFQKLGVEAMGCEGSAMGVKRCPKDTVVFQADLRQPLAINRTFELVICVEVAEHLPARAEKTLVASIANAASNRVLFSASGPGQDGDDHINLKPPEHWVALFRTHGFREDVDASIALRSEMVTIGAPEWYQNLVVLERH